MIALSLPNASASAVWEVKVHRNPVLSALPLKELQLKRKSKKGRVNWANSSQVAYDSKWGRNDHTAG